MAKKETATNEGNVITSEWKMIHKPENVTKDTLFVIQTISGGPSERVGVMPADRIIAEAQDKAQAIIAEAKQKAQMINSRFFAIMGLIFPRKNSDFAFRV